MAVMTRKGASFFVSNDLIVRTLDDAIGPNAVAWTHKDFPLIPGEGKTVQQATAATISEMQRRIHALGTKR